jgi:hypothetical protein
MEGSTTADHHDLSYCTCAPLTPALFGRIRDIYTQLCVRFESRFCQPHQYYNFFPSSAANEKLNMHVGHRFKVEICNMDGAGDDPTQAA